ncbi:uncharacterized protein LOC115832442 [Nomascus leucogenys]|uniref:uncharacterized protein LOC115832442 n=1 Tax=Nomascus leucogenys TaxID=61853 RepID=UPI00122D8690|nr:uncharacterized protein LOC115832442 [Nomascus leucogenys]
MPPCSGGDGSTPPGPSLRDGDCPAQSAEYPRDRLDPVSGSPFEASSLPFLRSRAPVNWYQEKAQVFPWHQLVSGSTTPLCLWKQPFHVSAFPVTVSLAFRQSQGAGQHLSEDLQPFILLRLLPQDKRMREEKAAGERSEPNFECWEQMDRW